MSVLFSGRRQWLQLVLVDTLVRFISPILSAATLVCGTLASYNFKDLRREYPNWNGVFNFVESATFLWIFVGLALTGSGFALVSALRHKSLRAMQRDIKRKNEEIEQIGNNIRAVFDGLLVNVSAKLKLSQGDQVRISLYIHDPKRESFVPFGRYSPNPELRRTGRTEYPHNQGCIAEGWRKDWHFDNSFPDGYTERQRYCADKYNIPENIFLKLRMKSRLCGVKRIVDSNSDAVAVIVVEAENPDRFVSDDLQLDLEAVSGDLSLVIQSLRAHIPNPGSAAEKGL